MADWTKTNRFLGQFLPALMQNKMRQRQVEAEAQAWLNKTLQEYAAYGEQQNKTAQRQLLYSLIEKMADPRFFEKRTYPERQMGSFVNEILPPELQGQINLPKAGEGVDELTAAEGAMKNILLSVMNDEYPAEKDLSAAIRAFGYEAVLENIKLVAKNVGENLDREMRGREAGIQEELIPVRKKEVEVRKGELEFEKTGKAKKSDAQKRLEKLEDDIDQLSRSYYKGGMRPEETGTIRNQILNKVKEVAGLKKDLGVEPDAQYQALAAELQSRGFTREDLMGNVPLIKKLRDQGYSNWKILEFF